MRILTHSEKMVQFHENMDDVLSTPFCMDSNIRVNPRELPHDFDLLAKKLHELTLQKTSFYKKDKTCAVKDIDKREWDLDPIESQQMDYILRDIEALEKNGYEKVTLNLLCANPSYLPNVPKPHHDVCVLVDNPERGRVLCNYNHQPLSTRFYHNTDAVLKDTLVDYNTDKKQKSRTATSKQNQYKLNKNAEGFLLPVGSIIRFSFGDLVAGDNEIKDSLPAIHAAKKLWLPLSTPRLMLMADTK